MTADKERPVWPILAWITGALVASTVILAILGLWVDPRFGVLAFLAALFSIIPGVCLPFTWQDEATYVKKPRGWRKARRDAERQAYIEELEREVGM